MPHTSSLVTATKTTQQGCTSHWERHDVLLAHLQKYVIIQGDQRGKQLRSLPWARNAVIRQHRARWGSQPQQTPGCSIPSLQPQHLHYCTPSLNGTRNAIGGCTEEQWLCSRVAGCSTLRDAAHVLAIKLPRQLFRLPECWLQPRPLDANYWLL